MRYYEIEYEMYQRAVELIEKRYPIGWGGAGVVHTSKFSYLMLPYYLNFLPFRKRVPSA